METKHLITIEPLETESIWKILSFAAKIKKDPNSVRSLLENKCFGLIFEKPSTRTWVSFETGVKSMGGEAIYLGPNDIKLNVREETKDVARVLARYLDGAILRTFKHETVDEFFKYFKKPVVNGLTDRAHPCQAFADFMTLQENFGDLKGLTLAYVGDANNVLNSLLFLAAKLGVNINFACPKPYVFGKEVLERAMKMAEKSGAQLKSCAKPEEAVAGVQAVYTDVWVSMGEEKIAAKKKKHFKNYQVNSKLMKLAAKNAIVLHCLPAHRGEEITDEVMESPASRIFDQAENRLHVQKAILAYLFDKIS